MDAGETVSGLELGFKSGGEVEMVGTKLGMVVIGVVISFWTVEIEAVNSFFPWSCSTSTFTCPSASFSVLLEPVFELTIDLLCSVLLCLKHMKREIKYRYEINLNLFLFQSGAKKKCVAGLICAYSIPPGMETKIVFIRYQASLLNWSKYFERLVLESRPDLTKK